MSTLNISEGGKNWSLDVTGTKMKLSLGNTTTEGWYWTGKQDQFLGFLQRLNASKVKDEFLQVEANGTIHFSDFRSVLLKNASHADGLYQISGDNVLWRFGEGWENDEDSDIDGLVEEGFSKETAKKIIDDAYGIHYVKYEGFQRQYKKEYVSGVNAAINSSGSFAEFFTKLDDMQATWLENSMEYHDELWRTAIWKAAKKYKKSKGGE